MYLNELFLEAPQLTNETEQSNLGDIGRHWLASRRIEAGDGRGVVVVIDPDTDADAS